MSVSLPPLPYAYNALEPYIGQRTCEIHHDKHHAKYVANVNQLIAGTDLENADLLTIIKGMCANGGTHYAFIACAFIYLVCFLVY